MISTVKVKLEPGAFLPILSEWGSAGYDLSIPENTTFSYGELVTVDIGVRVESPWPMMLKLRSSMVKQGFMMPDWGLIDPAYRGTIKVPVVYMATELNIHQTFHGFASSAHFGTNTCPIHTSQICTCHSGSFVIPGAPNLAQTKFGQRQFLRRGDRFAQLVFFQAAFPIVEAVEELSKTGRGDGGFGSTGR